MVSSGDRVKIYAEPTQALESLGTDPQHLFFHKVFTSVLSFPHYRESEAAPVDFSDENGKVKQLKVRFCSIPAMSCTPCSIPAMSCTPCSIPARSCTRRQHVQPVDGGLRASFQNFEQDIQFI